MTAALICEVYARIHAVTIFSKGSFKCRGTQCTPVQAIIRKMKAENKVAIKFKKMRRRKWLYRHIMNEWTSC